MHRTVYIGCDIGSVSAKTALLGPAQLRAHYPDTWLPAAIPQNRNEDDFCWLIPARPVHGDPLTIARQLQAEITACLPPDTTSAIAFTGSGGRLAAAALGAPFVSDHRALVAGVTALYPQATAILEISGARSSFLRLAPGSDGKPVLQDFSNNGACAAGSGSFLDQQALRLGLDITELAEQAATAPMAAAIAGRCSVFARSDMIHAQQKGMPQAEILAGLCRALARSFQADLLQGRDLGHQAICVGGVAQNRAVIAALCSGLDSADTTLLIPPQPVHCPAIGAALLQREGALAPARSQASAQQMPQGHLQRLTMADVLQLPAAAVNIPVDAPLPVYLGLDIGSVSTNLVCIDQDGRLLREIYLRTQGRPLAVVTQGLEMLSAEFGPRLIVLGVGTTGSGRELIGELVGADAIHDEITAHATGASHFAARCLEHPVDTILEIGGQDAKFIRIDQGVVVDFAMNEACSAGTGSFLEEQAERLGVAIDGEFARLALAAEQPVQLGERCTVFMEQDLIAALGQGESRENLAAGVAYGVVQNYLHRVKGNRPVGTTVFFQGGTAYNHAVAAAFAQVLGTTVIIPPHNGTMGAFGAALLARQKMLATGQPSAFRGFATSLDRCQHREFTCTACSNHCTIQEYGHDGRTSHWGDKCAVRFRRQSQSRREPVIEDLFARREHELQRDYWSEFLTGDHGEHNRQDALRAQELAAQNRAPRRVALLRTLYHFDFFPFWQSYLPALGLTVQLSPPTTADLAASGVAQTVAEPCFPIQIAHGHARAVADSDAELILLPALINGETNDPTVQSHFCPWGQTLPYVLAASPALANAGERLLTPILHFRQGPERVEQQLWACFAPYTRSRQLHRLAVELGFRALSLFRQTMMQAGATALATLQEAGASGLVMLGRSYTLHDPGLNLYLPAKLRQRFGVNLIPLDCLPLAEISISDLSDNLYWHSGRRLLQGARFSADQPHLHGIWLTHFGCGPDSYVKPLGRDAAGKPLLVLQLDGHGNDAGLLTRCEAYLHSLGLLS